MAVFTAVLAMLDICTTWINTATIYTIPAFFAAVLLRPRYAFAAFLILALLGYAGLFIGPRPDAMSATDLLFDFRMVNRTLSAAAIISVGVLIWSGQNYRRRVFARLRERKFTAEDSKIYLDLLERLEVQRALLITVIVVVSLFLTDFASPRELNLPILYGVPLILCASSRSIRMIWIMLPIVIALCWIGYFYGRVATQGINLSETIVYMNRIIASAVMVLLAVLATMWIRMNNIAAGDESVEQRA